MFNIGAGELVVILLIALIVLGPQRLPDAARQVGRVMGDLRRISSGFQQELKDALDTDDSPTPLRRKESAPLAASVADADAATTTGTAGGSAPPLGRSAASAGAAGTGTRDQTTVAPAVAAALDEVVAPIDAPPGSEVATSASDRATTQDSGDDPGQAGGADGGADLGDERAAS
ncbi:MAG: Sec-independent protein translocase protein TatB [Acidimicrobiales bacterium]|nr:Sec-independent protein translocase protein TatB [Acidimicrobiales bacterium]